MEYYSFTEKIIHLNSQSEKSEVTEFLKNQSLSFDKDIEYTFAIFDKSRIIGTGSFAGRILKCIAVDSEYQSLGLTNKILSNLINEQYRRGNIHLFLYTKPENNIIFSDLGFYKIAEVSSKVILMENKKNGIGNYLKNLQRPGFEVQETGAIVVNCNPFTLGHRYLIEYAAKKCEVLNIFVVWENRSSFPSEIRYKLVKEGVKHISNVIVHKGEDYIISDATFPSYFIKEYNEVVKVQAMLDLEIFSKYIAPSLNINMRFVGEEPYCPVTSIYNSIMKSVLPINNIKVFEIPRISVDNEIISASKVRKLLAEDKFEEVKKLVPESTYNFIISDDAKEILKNIKSNNKRH